MNKPYDGQHIAVFGATGAIGSACVKYLITAGACVSVITRSTPKENSIDHPQIINRLCADITDEVALASVAERLGESPPLNGVLVCTGLLHGKDIQPEKSIKQICATQFMAVMSANALGPALVARYVTPLLATQQRVWFAALSARVGSIGDNRLGGWYAYRAAKAALNMVIKNLSIELGRRNKAAIVVGLHPGTVDSGLSKPFQARVAPDKLFTPEHSAECLLSVVARLSPDDTGCCFDWAGKIIPP